MEGVPEIHSRTGTRLRRRAVVCLATASLGTWLVLSSCRGAADTAPRASGTPRRIQPTQAFLASVGPGMQLRRGAEAASPTISWFRGDFAAACRTAQAMQQPVLLFLYGARDVDSVALHRRVFRHPRVRRAARNWVCFSADTGKRRGAALAQRFGVFWTPQLLLFYPGTHGPRPLTADPEVMLAETAAMAADAPPTALPIPELLDDPNQPIGPSEVR